MGLCGSNEIHERTSNPTHIKRGSAPPYSRTETHSRKSAEERVTNRGKTLKGGKKSENPNPTAADLRSNKSRTTSASSHSAKPASDGPKVIKDEYASVRNKEKWYYDYLKSATTKQDDVRYVTDEEWLKRWIAFINNGGPRPWNDINKKMYVLYEDGRLGLKASRKDRKINKQLWNKLKEVYGSQLTIEVKGNKIYQIYLKKKKQETDEEMDLAGQDETNKSEAGCLATERDSVYPIMKGDKETESPARRMETTPHSLFDKEMKRILGKTRILLTSAESGNLEDLVDIHLTMKKEDKKDQKRRHTREIENSQEEYSSQPTCEIPDNCIAPPVGLKNYGVTCYVNASLQCLLSIPEMNTYFLNQYYRQTHFQTRRTDFRVCDAISELYNDIFSEPAPTWVAPRPVVSMCPSGQQDAHEFLWKKVFQYVQDETNPRVKKPRKENLNSKQSWEWYKRNHNSIFDILFSGMYESRVECKVCHNVSLTYDPFLDISLPVAKKTLESCLKLHFREEELSKEDLYKCSKCQKPVAATKSLKISKPPRYLILHIKRLVGGSRKISTFLQYPQVLDISKYCADVGTEAVYSLLALCVHNGGSQSGHYYALGKRGSKWYEFDDKRVTRVKDSDVLRHEAYMLFYMKL